MSQGAASEGYQAFRRGWKDSAKTWNQDHAWANHEKAHIRAAYLAGWGAQQRAHNDAVSEFAGLIGYDIALGVIDR